jgi:fibronectin-binding autotransporter adhesin
VSKSSLALPPINGIADPTVRSALTAISNWSRTVQSEYVSKDELQLPASAAGNALTKIIRQEISKTEAPVTLISQTTADGMNETQVKGVIRQMLENSGTEPPFVTNAPYLFRAGGSNTNVWVGAGGIGGFNGGVATFGITSVDGGFFFGRSDNPSNQISFNPASGQMVFGSNVKLVNSSGYTIQGLIDQATTGKYSLTALQNDLAAGVANVVAGVGSNYRLDVNTSNGSVSLKHKDVTYNGYSAVADSSNTRLPALVVTSAGLAAGYNDVDGTWKNSFVIDATTGTATFSGTVNASAGNFVGTITATSGTFSGSVQVGSGGVIYAGQSAWNTGTGFWLEYNGGIPRFSIGNSATSKSLAWDGTELRLNGTVVGTIISNAQTGANEAGALTLAGTANGKANTAITNAATAQTTADNAASTAATAVNGLTGKLNKAGTDILSGVLAVDTTTAAGIRVSPAGQTLSWNSAGTYLSGRGLALTPNGIMGHNGTKTTFAIDINGNASFSGTISSDAVIAATINANQINAGNLAAGVVYAGTINANQISTGTIAAGIVYAGTIGANQLTAGTITSNAITLSGAGAVIKAGQTAYNTGTGFWLDGAGNFSIGNSAGNYMAWNTSGGTLTINGSILSTSTIGGTPTTTIISGASAGATAVQPATLASNLTTKLNNSAADTLGGTISFNSSGAFKIGTATWDGTTATGTGVMFNQNGIVGVSGGVIGFSINASGAASFKGTISAGSVIAATMDAGNITTGTLGASVIYTGSLSATKITAGNITAAVGITSGYFSTGTASAWNGGTGAASGTGTGVLINQNGIVGLSSGTPTFTINASTGAATFKGDITGASGTFSGTIGAGAVISASVAASQITAGTITGNAITLSGAGAVIKAGQTAYNTGTGFWLDGSGNFSIGNSAGNYMAWNTGTGILTVNGAISATSTINGTTASTVVTGAASGATAVQPGTLTTSLAGKLSTNAAYVMGAASEFSTSGYTSTSAGAGGMSFTNNGIIARKRNAGNTGWDNKFVIDVNGNATFSGALSAATGDFAGSLTGASGTFAGNITAATVTTNNVNAAGYLRGKGKYTQAVTINASTLYGSVFGEVDTASGGNTGVIGYSNATGATAVIGVAGGAAGTTNGYGVAGSGGWAGVYGEASLVGGYGGYFKNAPLTPIMAAVYGYSSTQNLPGFHTNSHIRLDGQTSSGSGTANFSNTTKPSGTTTSNVWVKISLDGTTYYIPAWA